MSAAAVVLHASESATGPISSVGIKLAKTIPLRVKGTAMAMVPATALPRPSGHRPSTPLAKKLVARALVRVGTQREVAKACGVGQPRVAAWTNPESDNVPNLSHLLAEPALWREVAAEVEAHLAAQAEAIDAADLSGEAMQLGSLVGDLLREVRSVETSATCGAREQHARMVALLKAAKALHEGAGALYRGLSAGEGRAGK